MSMKYASLRMGRWYQGTRTLRMDRVDLRLAEDLVVTCEYMDGVPILGDFFPGFILQKISC